MSFDKMRRYITNQFVFLRNEMHFLEFKRCIFHLHLIITSLIYLFNIYMHDLEIIRHLIILTIWNTVIILVPKIISNIHPVMGIINLYHCHYKKVFLFDILFAFISDARSFCVHSFYFNRIRLQDTIKLSAINIFVMCFLTMYIYIFWSMKSKCIWNFRLRMIHFFIIFNDTYKTLIFPQIVID